MTAGVESFYLTLYVGVEDRSDEVAGCQDSPIKKGTLQ